MSDKPSMALPESWQEFIRRGHYKPDEFGVQHKVEEFDGLSVVHLRKQFFAEFMHEDDAEVVLALLRAAAAAVA